jgi:hypothetical protein
MKYFLGEIYITHKKTWLGWFRFDHQFTTDLIEAKDWLTAKETYNEYATKTMGQKPEYRYQVFVTMPIKSAQ